MLNHHTMSCVKGHSKLQKKSGRDAVNNKQIYQILTEWYPELSHYQLPDRQQRLQFEALHQWLCSAHQHHRPRRYIMGIETQRYLEQELNHNAVLQDLMFDIDDLQGQIRQAAIEITQYYEQHQNSIGSHCNLHSHLVENFLKRLTKAVDAAQHQVLLIYGPQLYWLVVPFDLDRIELFCLLFNKQFRQFEQRIEHYQTRQLSW